MSKAVSNTEGLKGIDELRELGKGQIVPFESVDYELSDLNDELELEILKPLEALGDIVRGAASTGSELPAEIGNLLILLVEGARSKIKATLQERFEGLMEKSAAPRRAVAI